MLFLVRGVFLFWALLFVFLTQAKEPILQNYVETLKSKIVEKAFIFCNDKICTKKINFKNIDRNFSEFFVRPQKGNFGVWIKNKSEAEKGIFKFSMAVMDIDFKRIYDAQNVEFNPKYPLGKNVLLLKALFKDMTDTIVEKNVSGKIRPEDLTLFIQDTAVIVGLVFKND